ncbi:hypothetical protein RP20_CCG001221 [Aedes albopictus]|nr:hypothetical protein RP20_CCG001221 [Aedes albopictus]
MSQLRLKRESEDEESYLFEEDEQSTRPKRQARTPVTITKDIHDQIDNMGYKMKSDFKDPHASIGLKIFGNDLKYYTIEGFTETLKAAEQINPLNFLKSILSGKEVSYTKSGVFLDTSYDVPVSVGKRQIAIHHGGQSLARLYQQVAVFFFFFMALRPNWDLACLASS